MRRFLLLLTAFFPILTLSAQETTNGETPSAAGTFPLALVLERAEYAGEGVWQPDWPLELPPDAFRVKYGEISRCVIEGEGVSMNLRFGPEGRIEEFPFMMNGRMAQVSLGYRGISEIRDIVLTFPNGDESWKMEILEQRDFLPFLVRAFRQDAWYFIYFSRGVNEILETWYNEIGDFLGAYGFSLTEIGEKRRISAIRLYGPYIEENDLKAAMQPPDNVSDFSDPNETTGFFYDSRGFLTETSGPGGLYKVLYYREDLPRYWERRPSEGENGGGNFALQWDRNGFLLRIYGEADGDGVVDYRYEYTFDRRGNWIERREIRMLRQSGLLIPSPGTTFRRVLEYRE